MSCVNETTIFGDRNFPLATILKMKVAKRRLIEKMSLENCMQWRDLTERKESVTHTSDCRHLMTCRLWDNYQRLWILSMWEKTKSMQTGPKREYVMAIMADNQGTINCDEWWTNLIFLLNILNGITKQTHSLFQSCLSQNPFIPIRIKQLLSLSALAPKSVPLRKL